MKNKSSSALFIGLLKSLSLVFLLPLTGVLAIALLLTMLAMFAGLFSAVSPAQTLSLLYRYVVPEHFKTEQLIETADGKQITVHTNKYWYTSKYSLTLNAEDYPAWTYDDLSRPVGELTSPVTFDVVKGVPWIVLPIRGVKCSEYGFPREGFATFKLENKMWKQVPYEQAPPNLHVNLSHVDDYKEKITPEISKTLAVGLYNNSMQIRNYVNEDGSGKAIKESAKLNMGYPYIADTRSCYYLNPPVDPDEKRSLSEYEEVKAVKVQAKKVKESEVKIDLSDNELKQLYLIPKIHGNCDKVVKRHYAIQIAKENQVGIFKSLESAERLELNVGASEVAKSFYLPLQNSTTASFSVLNCQSDRIVVGYVRDMNSLQVLEYNFNAQLLKKWSVQLPLNVHPVSDISIENNRIKIELVDFIRDEYFQGKKIPAKIIGQYSYEAELPL